MNVRGARSAVAEGARDISSGALGMKVFLAALGPMVTVPAIRRLVVDVHGGSPSSMHVFVAVGMMGGALGAPLVAAKADARGNHVRVAALLALVDAGVQFATSSAIPTALVFVLRPIHGLASMGLLALLFSELRRSGKSTIAYIGAAMIAALALGPAIGGILSKVGPVAPFRMAAAISALLACTLGVRTAFSPSANRPRIGMRRESMWETAKPIAAPLWVAASQRFAIGGLVSAFAVQARAVHGISDARVGAYFSTLLVAFAIAMMLIGRSSETKTQTTFVPAGAVLFAAAFVALAFGPTRLLPVALVAAGLGSAAVYAPCLALVSAVSSERTRATSMALLHSAGAIGMSLGPLLAAGVDVAMHRYPLPIRCATFMAFAGIAHAIIAVALAPRLVALAAAPTPNKMSRDEGALGTP